MDVESHTTSFPVIEDVVVEETAKGCTPGITPDQVTAHYNHWSQEGKYDQHYEGYYRGPAVAAAAVLRHTDGAREVSVLDVAAGTGLVGHNLKQLGYRYVDALDPSEGMLQAAKRKNIYRKYFNIFFTGPGTVIQQSAYDVLVCCGALMDGHLKCDFLTKAVHCVKKGGLVVLVMREEYLWTVSEFRDRLEPYMDQLENEGQWERLERTNVPGYFYKYNGILYVFRVTK